MPGCFWLDRQWHAWQLPEFLPDRTPFRLNSGFSQKNLFVCACIAPKKKV
jgi:hypothetical protein